jgi:molybdate transport system substrate-binding protein
MRFYAMIILVVLLVTVIAVWHIHAPVAHDRVTLTIFCAAALKPVIEHVAKRYEAAHNIRLETQYGASGLLLSNIKFVRWGGDIYLPADASYIESAKRDGLIMQAMPLASMTPVLVTRKSKSKRITSLPQLCSDTYATLACADPEIASIGKITRAALLRSGEWKQIEPHITVTLPTVTDVANAVKIGSVDYGIVWDAVARQYPEMSMIHLPSLDQARQRVSIGVLTTSPHPEHAKAFAQFLASPEGQSILRKLGYETAVQ